MFLRKFLLPAALLGALIQPLAAQEVPNAKDVGRMLFQTGARSMSINMLGDGILAAAESAAIAGIIKDYRYFAAVAMSASGLSEAIGLVADYHSIEGAKAAALNHCNTNKGEAEADCVIVAEVVPKKYKGRRAVQLSLSGTLAFRKNYLRAKNNKAFATSESTAAWAFVVGQPSLEEARASAIAQCAAKTGAEDCVVVTEN